MSFALIPNLRHVNLLTETYSLTVIFQRFVATINDFIPCDICTIYTRTYLLSNFSFILKPNLRLLLLNLFHFSLSQIKYHPHQ